MVVLASLSPTPTLRTLLAQTGIRRSAGEGVLTCRRPGEVSGSEAAPSTATRSMLSYLLRLLPDVLIQLDDLEASVAGPCGLAGVVGE
jgi:hypothetical protein